MAPLARIVALCCNAQAIANVDGASVDVDHVGHGKRRLVGHPVDVNLQAMFDVERCSAMRAAADIVVEVPFDARIKLHLTVVASSSLTKIDATAARFADNASAAAVAASDRLADGDEQPPTNAKETMLVLCKGAPEALFAMSSHFIDVQGKRRPIDSTFRRQYHEALQKFANDGLFFFGSSSSLFHSLTKQ